MHRVSNWRQPVLSSPLEMPLYSALRTPWQGSWWPLHALQRTACAREVLRPRRPTHRWRWSLVTLPASLRPPGP
eukprot:scaffold246095_cov33-Tisochrysis_lutea.AAC.1